MAFSPQFLDQIKDQIELVSVIGRRVNLKKKGREYLGVCPFHNEKTASFTVNEDKGFFHCFGCGEHGSIFDFLMKIDNLTFPEAVERLANEAGLDMPSETQENEERSEYIQKHYEVLERASLYYEGQLHSPEGKKALQYLLDRGINYDAIKKFRLGLAQDQRGGLRGELMRAGVNEQLMVEAGLLIAPEDKQKSPFERFRSRVIFPISDRKGRVIAFGGRILGAGEPKYLNSPETPLFQKGRNLYGLSQALGPAREKEEFIVTEGYTDVIALHQSGFDTAVAPLGTAVTEEQIQLLWRFVREPLMCFDGDSAGRRAAIRTAERALPYLKPGYSFRFTMLPEGEDPDNFIKSHGPKAMREMFVNSINLYQVLWDFETSGYKLDTPEERSWLEKRLRERATQIEDETVRRYYLTEFKERLWQKFRNVQTQLSSNKRKQGYPHNQLMEKSGIGTQVDSKNLGEAILIYTLVSHPLLFDQVGERLGTITFSDPNLDKLRQEVLMTLTSFEELGEGLDSKSLEDHLIKTGCSALVSEPLRRRVNSHASFSRPDENLEGARIGWEQQFRIFKREQLLTEVRVTKERLMRDLNREDFELLKVLKQSVAEIEETDTPLDDAVSGAKDTGTAA